MERKIKWLKSSSSKEWIRLAINNPSHILIDHAHCERKAAGFALELIFRYTGDVEISEILSPLVREELEHYERVLSLLRNKCIPFVQQKSPPYGKLLTSKIRKDEPLRMLDSFLIAGIIEARSHERMSLLAENFQDQKLKLLYGDLLKSEAKHFSIYWQLAFKRFDKEMIDKRLHELSFFESKVLCDLHPVPRIHS